ncbi:MAG: DUF2007 domain-containing protein [Bradyrhizobiaceae bacterium]|nr:DUF2007 domain-containing protein [Bradyrhizobiaceae bacterium]
MQDSPIHQTSYAVVATFPTVIEAEICKGMLQAHGITATLHDAESVSMYAGAVTALGGVKVVVPQSQADLARGCINSTSAQPEHIDVCTQCGSTSLAYKPDGFLRTVWRMLSASFQADSGTIVCKRCGHKRRIQRHDVS